MAPTTLAEAAEALAAGTPRRRQRPALRALLDGFGLSAAAPEAAGDAALLRLAARIGPLFRLPAPDAPGLVVLGAAIELGAGLPPASASGVGETPAAALRACLGEATELLASVETEADRAAMRATRPRAPKDAALEALLAALPWPGGVPRTGWVRAERLTDGRAAWLPRELVFRIPEAGRAIAPPWPLSLGCAAGPTPEHAALHGLQELVERDAAALWWRGGLPARGIALEHPAQARAAALLARLRAERAGRRRSWLLDITTELGVPVVAALSVDAEGRGFCCGLAARAAGLAPAAEAAVLELAQMELAQALVARKAALRGEASLNPRDLAHRRRSTEVDATGCPLLHPALPPAPDAALVAEDAPASVALAALLARLAAQGLVPLRVALEQAPGAKVTVPVLRMLCPGLETEQLAPPGPRLAAAIARTGGGAPFRAGVTLG